MGISLYEQFQKEQGGGGTGSLREEFEREQGMIQPSPTQVRVRQAIKSPEGRARLETGNAEKFRADLPSLTDYARAVPEAFETIAAGVPGTKLAISGYRSAI